MHRSSERFHELLKELGALHDKKQGDYGTDEDPFANIRASEGFGIPAWLGAVMRLNDKVVRLKAFAKKGSLNNESVEDSLRDIAVYATIALVLYEELSKEATESGCWDVDYTGEYLENLKRYAEINNGYALGNTRTFTLPGDYGTVPRSGEGIRYTLTDTAGGCREGVLPPLAQGEEQIFRAHAGNAGQTNPRG